MLHAIKNIIRKMIYDKRIYKLLRVKFYNVVIFIKNLFNCSKKSDYSCVDDLLKSKYNKCDEIYMANMYYGTAGCMRRYCYNNNIFKGCIEHGLYFGNIVSENEVIESGFPCVGSFGKKRKEIIRKFTDKPIFLFGPYIAYAESLLTPYEINEIKQRLGKILLVFPTHSIESAEVQYDIEEFIRWIEIIKTENDFQTVFVCMYFVDYKNNIQQLYTEKGYKIVCAGRRDDPFFLSRLKTFFELSDYSISNNVGTYTGYSIFMKCPHTIFSQNQSYRAVNADGKAELSSQSSISLAVVDNIKKAFSNFSFDINSSQYEICNNWWGFDQVKKPEELSTIIDISDQIYRLAQKKEENYVLAANEVLNSEDKYSMKYNLLMNALM